MQIRFDVSPCKETGGYVARWDDPAGGGICTQGESISELEAMVRDAVEGYFAERQSPERIQLHFLEDPLLALA